MDHDSDEENDVDFNQMYIKNQSRTADVTMGGLDMQNYPLNSMQMQNFAPIPIQPIPGSMQINQPHESIQHIQSVSSAVSGESTINIKSQEQQSIDVISTKKDSIPIIAYKILLHLLLLYAVVAVTYLLLTDKNCDCSNETAVNSNDSMDYDMSSTTSTLAPILESAEPTINPTKEPTTFPTKTPTKYPTPVPSINPTPFPTNAPTVIPTPSPTITISSNDILPQNGIIIWSNCTSGNMPVGWSVCDGTNGTPDLRGKFLIAADNTNGFIEGDSGGNTIHTHAISTSGTVLSHSLTVNEMPSHNHNNGAYQYLLRVTGDLTEEGVDSNGPAGAPDIQTSATTLNSGGGQGHSHGLTVSSTAGNTNNLPPYYVICYIMKTETTTWIDY